QVSAKFINDAWGGTATTDRNLILSHLWCEPTTPSTPAPTEPAPSEPVPTEPAPSEPAPTEPAPSEPAPTTEIAARVNNKAFPAVFAPWANIDQNTGEDDNTKWAKHDLQFRTAASWGLKWSSGPEGTATSFTSDSIQKAKNNVAAVKAKNPNVIALVPILYRDADVSYLGETHPWWLRVNGSIVKGWEEGNNNRIDFRNADFQNAFINKAKSIMATGTFDGIMLDWWNEDEVNYSINFGAERVKLVKKLREAIGSDALIIVNSNLSNIPEEGASSINGLYMESGDLDTRAEWDTARNTLTWAEANLRKPTINSFEVWYNKDTGSRGQEYIMRAGATFSLTQSNGYTLFADPNDLLVNGKHIGDHKHNWYSFWSKGLGNPKAAGYQRSDGAYQREFDNGIVIYNPVGNPAVKVTLPKAMYSRAQGKTVTEVTVNGFDGDIFTY
ncbi:MAG: putative glycoside hydrolase, partial [Trueperaceae bacterium]